MHLERLCRNRSSVPYMPPHKQTQYNGGSGAYRACCVEDLRAGSELRDIKSAWNHSDLNRIPILNQPSAPHIQAANHATSASGGNLTPCAMGKAIGYRSGELGGKRRGRCCRSIAMIVIDLPGSISYSRVGDLRTQLTFSDRRYDPLYHRCSIRQIHLHR